MVYFSKKYGPTEKNHATNDKVLLEIFKACQKWRWYLERHQTKVFTNHKLLVKL